MTGWLARVSQVTHVVVKDRFRAWKALFVVVPQHLVVVQQSSQTFAESTGRFSSQYVTHHSSLLFKVFSKARVWVATSQQSVQVSMKLVHSVMTSSNSESLELFQSEACLEDTAFKNVAPLGTVLMTFTGFSSVDAMDCVSGCAGRFNSAKPNALSNGFELPKISPHTPVSQGCLGPPH